MIKRKFEKIILCNLLRLFSDSKELIFDTFLNLFFFLKRIKLAGIIYIEIM